MKHAAAPSLLIYNLFPRYFRTIDDWHSMIPQIVDMGFNSVFVNPFHETGLSGSLYAVKDYYRLNSLFLHPGQDPADWTPIKRFVEACAGHGINVVMDLVVNHTSFDSVLASQHPLWYKRDRKGRVVSPFAIDPADATKVTVWGDLAEINNRAGKDREGLWNYWDELVAFFQKIGIQGFRCDAAYKVPAALWKLLIAHAKARDPSALFLAETLGCRLQEVARLKPAGFDYLFNSVKWWNFDAPWCLEQHAGNQAIAPSIAFPESHDTERQAAQPPQSPDMQKNRYVMAAVFSRGLLMPQGYESGARTRMDVVRGTPDDVEPPQWRLGSWIGRVNALKRSLQVLSEEGRWTALTTYNADVLFLRKDALSLNQSLVFLVNKDWTRTRIVGRSEIPAECSNRRHCVRLFDDAMRVEPVGERTEMGPSEIVALVDESVAAIISTL